MLLVEVVGAAKLHVRGSLMSDGVNIADRVLLDEELVPTTALVTEAEWVVEVVLAEEDLGKATGPGVKKGTRGLVNASTMELAVHGAVTVTVTVSLAGDEASFATRL